MAEDQRLTPGAGSLFIACSDRIDDTKAVFRNSIWGFDGANWNRAIVDASGTLKTTGGGGGGGGTVDQGVGGTDPWLIEGEVTIGGQPIAVTGPLTDAELRATPVDVLGPLTDTELRATPVPVSGPLTDAQLRAVPVPVSGTVTITDGSGPVTVDGTVAATQSGSWTVAATQSGSWSVTITDGSGPVTVDGTVAISGTVAVTQSTSPWVVSGTVDTELETAAALADGQSNPTLPRVGAIVLQAKYVDGTLSFDRAPHSYYQNRTGAGNASGAGTTIDMTMGPCSTFGLQVENGTGTTSAWNIDLQGSMDGTSFFQILNQTNATGTAQLSNVGDKSVRFCRSFVNSVTGGGTVRIRILGTRN